jgi:hypothetical protein
MAPTDFQTEVLSKLGRIEEGLSTLQHQVTIIFDRIDGAGGLAKGLTEVRTRCDMFHPIGAPTTTQVAADLEKYVQLQTTRRQEQVAVGHGRVANRAIIVSSIVGAVAAMACTIGVDIFKHIFK